MKFKEMTLIWTIDGMHKLWKEYRFIRVLGLWFKAVKKLLKTKPLHKTNSN